MEPIARYIAHGRAFSLFIVASVQAGQNFAGIFKNYGAKSAAAVEDPAFGTYARRQSVSSRGEPG